MDTLIRNSILEELGDTLREGLKTDSRFSYSEIDETIRSISDDHIESIKNTTDVQSDIDIELFVTLEQLPNIQDLDLVYENEVYMTMLNDCPWLKDEDLPTIAFFVRTINRTPVTVEIGCIENDQFVLLEEPYIVQSGTHFQYTSKYDKSFLKYIIVRLYATTDNINLFSFDMQYFEHSSLAARNNPVVDRYGRLYDFGDTGIWITLVLMRDKVKRSACESGSLYALWAYAYSLQELDVSDWDTSNWNVTTLNATFRDCQSLKKLDLSNWDTTNWTVAGLDATWFDCYSLTELNIGTWNTTNWAVTTLGACWYKCYRLKEIPIKNWNTSTWKVSVIDRAWTGCYSLMELKLNNWDTSKWVVTGLGSVWLQCFSLRTLEVSTWDTSNWAVNSLGSTWDLCMSLHKLDLSNWITDKWVVNSLYRTWAQCYQLKELIIPNWNTSKWVVTSMFQTWYGCNNITELNISGWNTSNWAVTSLDSPFYICSSLLDLDLSGWDVSNWRVGSLQNAWGACFSLKTLDISTWDVSKWPLKTLLNAWKDCMSLTELPVQNWDTSNWQITTITNCFNKLISIKELPIENWNTSNWRVEQLGGMVSSCDNIRKLDLSKWDTSNWVVSTGAMSLGTYCGMLREVDIHTWDTSNWSIDSIIGYLTGTIVKTADVSMFDMSKIKYLFPPNTNSYTFGRLVYTTKFICGEHNYNKFYPSDATIYCMDHGLSRDRNSIIELMKMLAPVPSGEHRTFVLYGSSYKNLYPEDIAIATNKGWTVEYSPSALVGGASTQSLDYDVEPSPMVEELI